MTYEEIYSQFYSKKTDPTFFRKYSRDEAYELMREWLHVIVGMPRVRSCFSSIALDDEIMELTFELVNPVDEYSDFYFVKQLFSHGMKICWMQQQVDDYTNMAAVVGGKEEKVLLNNYKPNIERLRQLNVEFTKIIRDHGTYYNEYIGEQ